MKIYKLAVATFYPRIIKKGIGESIFTYTLKIFFCKFYFYGAKDLTFTSQNNLFMRKFYIMAVILLCAGFFIYNDQSNQLPVASDEMQSKEKEDEEEGYDGPMERALLEFEKTKDPALGYVPFERLGAAMDYTEEMKQQMAILRGQSNLLWVERGPTFDSL